MLTLSQEKREVAIAILKSDLSEMATQQMMVEKQRALTEKDKKALQSKHVELKIQVPTLCMCDY